VNKFIIVFHDRGTVPHFEPDECSVFPPTPLTDLLLLYNPFLIFSHLYEDKLRVVVQFSKKFYFFDPLYVC